MMMEADPGPFGGPSQKLLECCFLFAVSSIRDICGILAYKVQMLWDHAFLNNIGPSSHRALLDYDGVGM